MQDNTGSEEVENLEQQPVAPPGFPVESDGRTVGGKEMSKDSNSYVKADYCYFQPFQFTHFFLLSSFSSFLLPFPRHAAQPSTH
jgi:hypothetical protein